MEWRIWITDGSYPVSDIQNYFEYIWKKHGEKSDFSNTNIHK